MDPLSLRPELRQQMKLSPQVLQSMEVLQMNAQELLDYLNRMTEENPLLEQEEPAALRAEYEALCRKASWLDGGISGPVGVTGEMRERGAEDRRLDSLAAFLRDQLERRRLPEPLLALCRYLAELVDGDGYLTEEDLEGVAELRIPHAMIHEALRILQSLEPAGVGARSLSECLLLQLDRLPNVPPGTRELAERYLPERGRKRYSFLAAALDLPESDIREAERVIAGLEPHPGRAFQPAETAVYVRPDIFILEDGGTLRVVLNEYYLPKVSISSYYTRLLKDSGEEETQVYLRQKLQQARWLLNSLERRGATLRRCAEALAQAQADFFTGASQELRPMSRTALSEELGVHPSTVSRALRDKYLQCRQGTYPLGYFFNRGLGEGETSRQAVKRRLLELVRQEDPARPLSDRELCVRLACGGVEVARRTVAKYREELGIPSSAGRRRG